MTCDELLLQASRLGIQEKILLVEALWDDIAHDASQVPIPDWHREVVRGKMGVQEPRMTWDAFKMERGIR